MPYKNAENPGGVEMHDRTLAKLSSTTEPLESQTLDLDARTLALLGKREKLKVMPTCAMSFSGNSNNRTLQQRIFGRVSLVAFSTTLLASWESIAV